mgnify:CR=1 FL=1
MAKKIHSAEKIAERWLVEEGCPLWISEIERLTGVGYKKAKHIWRRLKRRYKLSTYQIGSAKVIIYEG